MEWRECCLTLTHSVSNEQWSRLTLLEVIANAEPLPAALVCLTSDLRIVCSLSAWIFHLMWLIWGEQENRGENWMTTMTRNEAQHRERLRDRTQTSDLFAMYLCLPVIHFEQSLLVLCFALFCFLSSADVELSLRYRTSIVFIFSSVPAGVSNLVSTYAPRVCQIQQGRDIFPKQQQKRCIVV